MFEEFKELSANHQITFADNGYVVYVSGRGHEANWINKVYVFTHEVDFHHALSRLAEIPSS